MSKRGPPPKSMITLFHLLRRIPFLPNEEIAKELGVKPDTVRLYKWRLNKKLVTGVTYFDYCPECFSKSVILDREAGEYVCSNCGFVVEEDGANVSKNIPFGTEDKPNTFALTSNISYGKSLGFTMPKKHLFKVLARIKNKENNGKDQVLPIRQIQVISQSVDPPVVKNMLNYGSRMLKELGFDRDTVSNHILADRYGRLLRKVGAYIIVSKSRNIQSYQAARAALAYLLSKRHPEKAKEVTEKYPFHNKYMDLITMLTLT